jgi:hypothetical protein
MDNEKLKRDLEIIDEIEQVRTRNNVNWMDILRLGFTHAPEETRTLIGKINQEDGRISDLYRKLAE